MQRVAIVVMANDDAADVVFFVVYFATAAITVAMLIVVGNVVLGITVLRPRFRADDTVLVIFVVADAGALFHIVHRIKLDIVRSAVVEREQRRRSGTWPYIGGSRRLRRVLRVALIRR